MTLLRLIEHTLRNHDITATALGRRALNDPGAIFGIRKGREIRPATEARLRDFIASLERAA